MIWTYRAEHSKGGVTSSVTGFGQSPADLLIAPLSLDSISL